jgi:hypothetical protein
MATEQLETHGADIVDTAKVVEGLGSRVCTITRLDGTTFTLLAPAYSLVDYARQAGPLSGDTESDHGEDN